MTSDRFDFAAQNSIVQTASAEFLQYLLLKITDPRKASETAALIQDAVLSYLAESVSTSNLVLQVTSHYDNVISIDVGLKVQLLGLLRAIVLLDSYSVASGSVKNSQMFLQTLVIGLLQPSSKNIRFYWLEFITSCLPYLRNSLSVIMTPIIKCICGIIQNDSSQVFLSQSFQTQFAFQNLYDSISAKDILTLLKSLHILLMYCLQETRLSKRYSNLFEIIVDSSVAVHQRALQLH